MSSHLAPIDNRKLDKILRGLGFQLVRQKGSHAFYEHSDGRTTLVPIHSGEDIGKGLLKKIITEDLKLAINEFSKLR